MGNNTKAIAMISGGLDSIIAAKLIQDQGVEVIGIYFSSPFWSSREKEKKIILSSLTTNGIDIRIIPMEDDFIDMIRHPRHGKGKGVNPCIDCKIFMLLKAKKIMEELDASFIITGEVLGQRPMSQHLPALNLIEKESGLKGRLVRPLSGKLLPLTEPEEKGLLDRDKLLDIKGRGRYKQYELAEQFKIKIFTAPAGGCLLTEKEYVNKFNDYLAYNEKITIKDTLLLKFGRHFRYNGDKIIVGRNEEENEIINKLKDDDDYSFEVPDIGSPLTVLHGKKEKDSVVFAARLTALYSDNKEENVKVNYLKNNKGESININPLTKEEAAKYNLSLK